MPPKKKKAAVVIDGVDTSQMSREQLETFALKIKSELDREREERNYFQLERDKLRTFWEISREKLEEAKSNVISKDHDAEVATELADVEIKNITQRMKHLQYENNTKIGEIRAEALMQLKLAQEEHARREQELLRDKRDLRRVLRQKDEEIEIQTQQLKMKQAEELRIKTEFFEREEMYLRELFEQKLNAQNEENEIRRKMEIFEVEERKNTQIQKLLDSNDAVFNDMKIYYNDITLNNLELISSLKEQMEELRKQSERHERMANELMVENKKLIEPLLQAQSEVGELKHNLENYERDKLKLARLKKKYEVLEKEMAALKWESECVLLRNETLLSDRENLSSKFEEAVMELQQQTGLKNALLEKKINSMEKEAEKREVLLAEAFTATGIEPDDIKMRIDAIIEIKNDTIQDLRYELVRICKAHDDMLATYESKLQKYGIPKDELGFEPLHTTMKIKYGTGPANLVTKNK